MQYEKDFVEFMGGGFADGVNSGTNAVYAALGSLRLDPFSEVIVPPITDPGGVMPVALLGCVPVVADADPRSYNISPASIESLVTERTKAIIVAHIAGDVVDMDPILSLARERGIYVIEDCSQAHGARYKGKLVGTMGDVAAFSMMSGKHHCTGGQGGVVYTQKEQFHWQGRRFADRGKPFNIDGEELNVIAGLNCNLDDLSAAIGSSQLKKLPGIIKRRQDFAKLLAKALQDSQAVSMGFQLEDTESVYWFCRMKFNADAVNVDKAKFCDALAAEGVPVRAEYRYIPAEMPWFRKKAVFGESGLPWDCSKYKGSSVPVAKIDNAIKSVETHFDIQANENFGPQEAEDIAASIMKVQQAYAK